MRLPIRFVAVVGVALWPTVSTGAAEEPDDDAPWIIKALTEASAEDMVAMAAGAILASQTMESDTTTVELGRVDWNPAGDRLTVEPKDDTPGLAFRQEGDRVTDVSAWIESGTLEVTAKGLLEVHMEGVIERFEGRIGLVGNFDLQATVSPDEDQVEFSFETAKWTLSGIATLTVAPDVSLDMDAHLTPSPPAEDVPGGPLFQLFEDPL